jgi:hypothetical protein
MSPRRARRRNGQSKWQEEFPGANHFTVIDPLSDPQSDMIRRVVELTQVAKA